MSVIIIVFKLFNKHTVNELDDPNPVPCGTLDEYPEIINVIKTHYNNDYNLDYYAFNLIGKVCLVMANSVDKLKESAKKAINEAISSYAEKTEDEIIATIEKGIYVTEVGGLHAGLNPISGAFNVQATGYMIENGKKTSPVTLFVVSGNFFEMMNNVEEIGNDIEKRFTGVSAPTLKIKSLAISGK